MAQREEEANGDDDDVFFEMPVYLCKAPTDRLTLLQYIMLPADVPDNDQNVIDARIKPKQLKLEIERTRKTDGRNCDQLKSEMIALNTDGRDADFVSGNTYFNSSAMDKLVLTSSVVPLHSLQYVVGKKSDDEFHMTPLNSVLQMRHSFEFLDKGFRLGHEEESGKVKEEEQAQAVTVKFAGPNTERAKKIREKSYCYFKERMDAEPWVSLSYNPSSSRQSRIEGEKLIYTQLDNKDFNMDTPVHDVDSLLVPECLYQSHVIADVKSQIPMADKVRSLLTDAQVLKFHQVMEKVPDEQPANVEKQLQQIAYLVKGCWAIKSDVIFPKGYTSPFTGVGPEVLIRARDYLLWSLTKSEYITGNNILEAISVSVEDLTFLLTQVGKKVYNKGWTLKCTPDQDYIENHPTVVQRQDMFWDFRYKQLLRDLRLSHTGADAGYTITFDNSSKGIPPPPSPKERKHFKYRENFSGEDTEESSCESSSSEKMDIDFREKGRMIKKTASFKKRAPLSPVKNRSRHPSATGFDIGPRVLSALPSADIKAELINHVKCVLRETFCLTLSALKDSLVEAKLGFISQREDCESLLEETLVGIGAQKLKNKWPHNTQPAVLYAFTNFGSDLDRYRNALLDLFTSTARSRPNLLIKKLEDENAEIISESLCRQIFEEYCLYKAGYYYLKGTITPDFC